MIRNKLKQVYGEKENLFSVKEVVEGAVGSHANNCAGYGEPGSSGNNYILGVVLGVGKAELELRHDGSQLLDEINAFDRAEVENTTIGQINMTIVSSFCGPQGVIWGYDIARAKDLRQRHELGVEFIENGKKPVPVYSAQPLIQATRELFGTVNKKNFPLLPGAHVPCAGKSFKEEGKKHIYAGIAIGIPEDRKNNACLLMEDLGWIPMRQDEKSQNKYRKMILQNMAKSIMKVGENQRVDYEEIFLEITDIIVPEGQIGCALVAAPYFTLARNAVPNGGPSSLSDMSLEKWKKTISR